MTPAQRRYVRTEMAIAAVINAVPIAAMAGLAGMVVVPLAGSAWSQAAVAALKPLYGALLGGMIARLAIMLALRGRPPFAPFPQSSAATSTGRNASKSTIRPNASNGSPSADSRFR